MAPPRFQRVVIDGVGLLGGSLGMALRRRAMAVHVVGLGRSAERLERARALGAIDEIQTRPEPALAGADAVIFATPVRQIRDRLAEFAPLIEPGAFVTDVGSVKARIVEEAEQALSPEIRFIGSHPMAGSEKTGAEHGRSDFYERSACIITPTPRTHPETIELARRFWEALGSRVVVADPHRHDHLLAGISHLPHVVAAALIQSLLRGTDNFEEIVQTAGNGLRDTTRIAASDPDLWRQIVSDNAGPLLNSLDAFIAVLAEWRETLAQPADQKRIANFFAEAREARLKLENPADRTVE